tara:strand:+ start:3437 stop:3949 length:513 start_codon:yes stop_codon:yes gene_type:complete
MFNRMKKIIANRKASKRAMLESLVIEMSQEYLRAFEGEMKEELRDFCVEHISVEANQNVDHRQVANNICPSDIAEYICVSEVADYICTSDVAENMTNYVSASEVADYICASDVAEYVDVAEQVEDRVEDAVREFDFADEVRARINRLELDYDHIAEEVASRISIESTVIV